MNPSRKGNSHETVTPSLLYLGSTKAPDLLTTLRNKNEFLLS